MRPSTTHRIRNLGYGVLGLALVSGGVVGLSTAAQAEPHCLEDTRYEIQKSENIFIWDKKTFFRDGPGGVLHGTVTKASTIGGTFGTKAETEINAIFTKVKLEVNASVTRSMTTTVGHTYDHAITEGYYGQVRYGTWGPSVQWRKIQMFADCSFKVLSSGKALLPTPAVGFDYKEEKK